MPKHLTADLREQQGRSLRKQVPRSSHGEWDPGPDRPDPVALLEGQNEDRLQPLVPVRRGRMSASAFTFYRGAARIMASDLATTPATGLTVQACGDAHLSNFGAYASPARTLVFDVNDFDETLPGPWEWDLKRLATSFVIAGRNRRFDAADSREATRRSVDAYRTAMARFAGMRTLDVWYAHMSVGRVGEAVSGKAAKRIGRFQRKAKSKDSLQALSKLAEKVDGQYRIKSDPPVLVPLRDLAGNMAPDDLAAIVKGSFESYRTSLAENRRRLLERFRPVDVGLKVVGVGSVGTRCLIALMMGRDDDDPLFLQIKEATDAVLEEHLPPSVHQDHGERVVRGQRLMQAQSDIFLGWGKNEGDPHDYYWRQLKDWKGSVDIDSASPTELSRYGDVCGWTLAHAHARSGDPIAIAAYLGKGQGIVDAMADFAEAYADQNERDYTLFKAAIDDGQLEADTGS